MPDTQPESLPLLEALHTTPARRYLSTEPIPDEIVRALLDAAVRGPSGGNTQLWAWIVVTDPELKKPIADCYREGWETYYGNRREQVLSTGSPAEQRVFKASDHLAQHLEDAPVWIIPVLLGAAKAKNPRLGSSIYGAVQHLTLAARAYGIGATLTTLHTGREEDVRRILGLPDDALTMALIPLGYPEKGRWIEPKRKPLDEVVHYNGFRQS